MPWPSASPTPTSPPPSQQQSSPQSLASNRTPGSRGYEIDRVTHAIESGQQQQQSDTAYTFTCIFITNTLALTAAASICLSLSLLTDNWEYFTFNADRVHAIANVSNHSVTWLGERSARVQVVRPSDDPGRETSSPRLSEQPNNNTSGLSTPGVWFLVSVHGGVNSLCTYISDEERKLMMREGFALPRCFSYLRPEDVIFSNTREDRMRNLAMSCAMVSLILLAACALVGALGLAKKQISAIMVTGVMFLLAALFGTFTLAFMYFKRLKPEGLKTSTIVDKSVPIDYLKTRVFTTGWSASLGWAGITLCVITSILWLLLARILRYQALSTT